jgi:hypothetical protein
MANKNGVSPLGAAALVAAAAGAYYLFGKNGPKHRKQIRGWVIKAKGEVVDQLENLTDISKGTYDGIVNDVITRYKRLKKVTPREANALSKELKAHWNAIKSELKTSDR